MKKEDIEKAAAKYSGKALGYNGGACNRYARSV